MTSLQSPARPRNAPARSAAEVRRQLSTRRPLVPTTTLGGGIAAAAPLLVLMAAAVVGWFLTDAGGHGTPSGALRVGATAWLLGHGSGVSVEGVRVTAVPLGITLLSAWAVWRVGHRVGESISAHGPDADRIADGERDWTVPLAGALFTTGYVVVAAVTASLAATPASAPSMPRVVAWSLAISLLVGVPALARGSGRAAIWLPLLPAGLRAAGAVCRAVVVAWLVLAGVVLLVALVADFPTAANVVSQLDADAGDTAVITLVSLAVLPNATLFSSAYLLGPGFAVGTGTVVAPASTVTIGPLPMFPLLAALPDAGSPPPWAAWVMATPVLLAAVVAGRAVRGVGSWERAALRGCGGGLLAGLAVGLLTALSGGAVGPQRMQDVGPFSELVVLHAVTAFGIGGLVGALAMSWWQGRGAELRRRVRRTRVGGRLAGLGTRSGRTVGGVASRLPFRR